MNIYLTSYGIDTRYNDYMDSYSDIINVFLWSFKGSQYFQNFLDTFFVG